MIRRRVDVGHRCDRSIVHVVVGDGFAGTESYVCQAAVAATSRGWAVTVVGGHPAKMQAGLGAAVRWLPGSSVAQAAGSLLRVGRVDVVHAHMTAAELVATGLRRRNRGLFVCTRHFAARRGSTPLARALSPHVNRVLDRQIAISQFVAERLDTPPDVVLWHGLRPRSRPDRPSEQRVLLLQRLEPEKDTSTALHAWARSGLGEAGWSLRLAGQGQERPALEALARRLGVSSSTRFLGFVDDPRTELARADILVATASAEPFGLSVLEAMSFATPVVATAAGGHLETVGRASGACLFPPRDASALAGLLVQLAQDPPRRLAYGAELQRLQRADFDLDDHVTRLLAVYQS